MERSLALISNTKSESKPSSSLVILAFLLGVKAMPVGSRTRYRSKGEPGLVEKDLRSSGSGDLQPDKKKSSRFLISQEGRLKSHPSFTSLLQNNLFRETVFPLLQ
jgi:hypothetical protein